MPLELYNTLNRAKEPLDPVVPGKVGMYMCGPTVYSDPHLGHARGPIVFDVLRRWLEHEGYSVRLVTNITDVGHLTDDDAGEDKLLKRAKLERIEPMEVAEKYFWSYFDAMAALNIRRPSIVPRASGHIGEQVELVEELLAAGAAYERDGSVYFDVSAWDRYGELSGRDTEELVEGTRVEVRGDKDDPRDFALWKRAEAGHIMRWNSPWGPGFPGWHLECTVMSTKYLGDEFDIHGGGLDLVFPHHECELAQAAAAGRPFARTWLHWNMITLGGEKMAKSKNHFVTLEALFDVHDPIAVRFHLLASHYRSVSDFSDESLLGSAQGLRRLRETYATVVDRLERLGAAHGPAEGAASRQSVDSDDGSFSATRTAFAAAMNDDLNTPRAIATLFDASREIRKAIEDGSSAPYLTGATALFEELLAGVLG
ncbi:MAG TPA: cysteine--tRNA ligase, partial [Trueperaceae bacterium]|nr:cysteine--tRNA ligase [Trueperaceae bacterium]